MRLMVDFGVDFLDLRRRRIIKLINKYIKGKFMMESALRELDNYRVEIRISDEGMDCQTS